MSRCRRSSKLQLPESNLQWVITGYALTFGGMLLLGGRLADLLGRRRSSSPACACSPSSVARRRARDREAFLIPIRCLQGVGGRSSPAALSIVMYMFSEGAERNKALGMWGASEGAAAAVG